MKRCPRSEYIEREGDRPGPCPMTADGKADQRMSVHHMYEKGMYVVSYLYTKERKRTT